MNIQLQVKLAAYTKTSLPDFTKFVREAPDDGEVYVRKNNAWIRVPKEEFGDQVNLIENSGMLLARTENDVYLGVDQWVGKEEDLPATLRNATTYYTYKDGAYTFVVDGGTSFSGDEDFGTLYETTFFGGNASTISYNYIFNPMNSKGE